VLLMIAVAVVASLVAYAWVMGYMNFQTAKTGQAIQIQSIAYSNNTAPLQTLDVYVQNVGQGVVEFSSVYVNGTQWQLTPAGGQTSFDAGTTAKLTYSGVLPATLGSGSQVTVKVTTTDGTFSEVTKTFP
jgi:FlaG/FlaF family flagellin (archaellin)